MCWIDNLTEKQVTDGPFPLRNILKDSVYYPACAVDGSLVALIGGYFRSFIYVDYAYTRDNLQGAAYRDFHHQNRDRAGCTRDDLQGAIYRCCAQDRPGQNPPSQGFKGYRVFATRELLEEDLAPGGWRPTAVPDLALLARGVWREKMLDAIKNPFAIWVVYQRLDSYDDQHGPRRFSLVYLRAEGAAAYDALYHGQQIAPACLALVNSGVLGGNWETFESDDSFFRRLVWNHGCRPSYFFGLVSENRAGPFGWRISTEVVRDWPERGKRLWKLSG